MRTKIYNYNCNGSRSYRTNKWVTVTPLSKEEAAAEIMRKHKEYEKLLCEYYAKYGETPLDNK